MKIEKIHLVSFKNEEHFQFHSEFDYLVNQYSPSKLGIENEYPEYLACMQQEKEAIEPIRKSIHSDELSSKDKERDGVFRGFRDSVRAACNHYSLEVRDAAEKLWIVFDHYGNLATLSYNEETASIVNFIVDMRTNYSKELTTTGLENWVKVLEEKNNSFDTLMKERFSDDAQKTTLKMKQVRTEIDKVYRTIIEKINALIIVNGSQTYEGFVREMNERIDKYQNIASIRKGRNQSNEQDI